MRNFARLSTRATNVVSASLAKSSPKVGEHFVAGYLIIKLMARENHSCTKWYENFSSDTGDSNRVDVDRVDVCAHNCDCILVLGESRPLSFAHRPRGIGTSVQLDRGTCAADPVREMWRRVLCSESPLDGRRSGARWELPVSGCLLTAIRQSGRSLNTACSTGCLRP